MNYLKLLCLWCILLLFALTTGICDATIRWKMASVAPEGTAYAVYFKKNYTNTIKQITNGEVVMDWYQGCVMGDEEDYLAKIRINQLQGAVMSTGGTLMVCPQMAVLQLPFLFNDFDEVAYVRDKMRSIFSKIIIKNGYKLIMFADQDFDQIYSTKYPMNKIEDFAKCKVVNHAGFMENRILKALGASPIILGIPEVASATRSGIINTCLCPPLWTLGTQLYTIKRYVNTYKWRYSPAFIVVSRKAWDIVPEKYKLAINKKLPDLENNFNKKMLQQNTKALKAMIQYGLEEVTMTPQQVDEFRKRLLPLWDELAGKRFPVELLDEIKIHLKNYRLNKKQIGFK